MALAEEAGYDELLWRLIDKAAEFIEARTGGWTLVDEAVFRANAVSALRGLRLDLTGEEQTHVIETCADEVYRYGPLTPLMQQSDVTDIVVNGPTDVFVDRGGGLRRSDAAFRSPQHLHAFAVRHLARAGKAVNRASPVADTDLDDGSRLHVVGPPVSGGSMTLSIRKFRTDMGLAGLVGAQGVSIADAELLKTFVDQRKNILIAGGPGAGKTTLMGALLGEVALDQRIVGIEDVPELRPKHPHYVRLLTRRSSGPYLVETSVRDLVREALRMRPDRLVVGEVRGPEALDMVSAMTTGMDGSMTTIHASSAAGAVKRLGALLEIASGSEHARRMAGEAIDVVIFIRRQPDGRRTIEAIDHVG